MLCLREGDILKAVTPEEIVDAVESAMRLYETNEFHMPDRMHVDYKENVLLLMPCFTTGKFSTKLVSVFPGNAQKNVPVVIGTVVLNDGATGEPLALLNGTVLTAVRTGAVGAVGIRYLTSQPLKTLGIVGAGVQGFHQALFASYVRNLSDIFVFDIDIQNTLFLIEKLSKQRPGIEVHQVKSVEELLQHSEAVITATTYLHPVLPDKRELLEGKHFVGIGSYRPDMREFPEALFRLLNRVLIDTRPAVVESGDLATSLKNGWIKENQVSTMGKWITTGEKIKEGETTLFKSVGMALFDLVVSDLIYQKAGEKGLGTNIEL
jgi:ornithine cyclodeaminase/alanine dehydrogenase-like protein (mu-crystallin family)